MKMASNSQKQKLSAYTSVKDEHITLTQKYGRAYNTYVLTSKEFRNNIQQQTKF